MTERILRMPRLGETMEEGRIVGFLVKPGDSFKRGDSIIEIETDKTVAEFPALGDGTLNEWIGSIGDHVVVGAPLARIEIANGPDWTDEGDESASSPDEPAVPSPARAAGLQNERVITDLDVPRLGETMEEGQRVRATPLARRIARDRRININLLSGTGRRGRVEKEDVLLASSKPASKADVQFVELAKGRVAYTDQGPKNAPTFLLLHGFSGDRTTWSGVASGLRRTNSRVIAPDLPAHGLTSINAGNIDELNAFLPAFMDALSVNTVHVVAHSLGAVAAASFAATNPERVSELTLVAPAGLGSQIDASFISGMAHATTAGEITHLLRRVAAKPIELSPELAMDFANMMARGRLKTLAETIIGPSGQRADIIATLEKLSRSKPVRVLFGLQDRIIPWQQVTLLPPSIGVHFFAQSGHMPQWDQTKDVLDLLLNFTGGAND